MSVEDSGFEVLPDSSELVKMLTAVEANRLRTYREADEFASFKVHDFADYVTHEAGLNEAEAANFTRKLSILHHFLPGLFEKVGNIDEMDTEKRANLTLEVNNLPGIHIKDFLGAMSIAANGWGVSIMAISTEHIPVLVKPDQPEEVALSLYREAALDAPLNRSTRTFN